MISVSGLNRAPGVPFRVRKGSKIAVTMLDGKTVPFRVTSSRWNPIARTQMIELEETL